MIKCTKVSITREKCTRDYVLEGAISFSDEDAEGIVQPHNDALIKGRTTIGVHDQIVPAVWVLNGFNMACETTKGEISLPVNTVGTTQKIKLYVIEGDMRYNALFERPWVHNMRAVPSTLYHALKFPTPAGVKTIYGEQPIARKMFVVDEVIPVPAISTSRSAELAKKEETK
uniref:Uncharacterized protein n=1 Tax=Nicotiana tabacum TaxID=4097 RepID=A0A1S3XKP5_TOBAC|nr:uncharacterized protein LOC104094868 [Nicotiana tomentosiformis]XP_016440488.1 PREDICTED: uncharacterized protein LOC107766248 [Nicotiana tabacum]